MLERFHCLIAGHLWGEWRALAFQTHRQERACIRCHWGQTRSQAGHDWGDWEWMQPQLCLQRRICMGCAEAEVRPFHAGPFTVERRDEAGEFWWDGPTTIHEINTVQISTCQNCGTAVKSEIVSCQWERRERSADAGLA